MAQYRKKPIIIDAVQWNGENIGEVLTFLRTHQAHYHWIDSGQHMHLEIQTLEGNMRITPQDYIIRGVKGEVYPCKPDIFAATYEPAGWWQGRKGGAA